MKPYLVLIWGYGLYGSGQADTSNALKSLSASGIGAQKATEAQGSHLLDLKPKYAIYEGQIPRIMVCRMLVFMRPLRPLMEERP